MSANAPQWIADPDLLNARLSTPPARIGLDTEFIRERTYWPRLALVQVAIGDDILLVDPLAPGITGALRPLLTDPSVLKIMHSAGEDLIAFGHACDAVPTPLFDTQVAAALGGIAAGAGYQRLVQELTGVALSKGETRSDWLRRPLSPAQLEYAADDVRHLFALHDTLAQRLETLGRRAWLDEDCERLLAIASDEPEPWPHLALRSAQFLDDDARSRLLRLLRWRDRWARERDLPRSWVLDNELAVLLARETPSDQSGVQRVLDQHPKASRKLAEPMWRALQTPLPDEHEAPVPTSDDDLDRRALRELQGAVAARSAELGLPDGVLASRRWLERLLQHGRWPQALSGWRRKELEPVLLPVLSAAADVRAAGQAS